MIGRAIRRPALVAAGPLGLAYFRLGRNLPGRIVAGRIANSHLRLHPRQTRARLPYGIEVACDTGDLIDRYLYLFGVWEPAITRWLERSLRPGDVFVDVGANVGYYTLLASRLVGPAGAVVAVEASPTIATILRSHLAANDVRNVRVENVAASDVPGQLRMYLPRYGNRGQASTVLLPGWEADFAFECEIPALPLTAVITPEEAARARVIKIDVEGAQAAVLQGLLPMLDGARDDLEVIVEAEPSDVPGDGPTLLDAFASRGFHCYYIENDYSVRSYIAAQRTGEVELPRRVRSPRDLTGLEFDLIFSRTDAEAL